MNTLNLTNTVVPIAGLRRQSIVSARIWFGILGVIVMLSSFTEASIFLSVFLSFHIMAGLIALTFLENHFKMIPERAGTLVSLTMLLLGYIALLIIAVQNLKKYPA